MSTLQQSSCLMGAIGVNRPYLVFVILSEVEESLNVVWPLRAWFDRKSQRCFASLNMTKAIAQR